MKMKYWKLVTITLDNGKILHAKHFANIRKIKNLYTIGGNIYGYGKIKQIDVKILKGITKFKDIKY